MYWAEGCEWGRGDKAGWKWKDSKTWEVKELEFHGLLTQIFLGTVNRNWKLNIWILSFLEIYGYYLGIKYKYDIRLMALIYFMVCLSIGNCIGLNLQWTCWTLKAAHLLPLCKEVGFMVFLRASLSTCLLHVVFTRAWGCISKESWWILPSSTCLLFLFSELPVFDEPLICVLLKRSA